MCTTVIGSEPAGCDGEILLGEAVLVAALAVSDDLACWLAEEGFWDVRTADWPVLRLLEGGPIAVGVLAGPLQVSQQAVSKAVISLEIRDYVCRATPEGDRRTRHVALTGRGHAALRTAAAWSIDRQRVAVGRWGLGDVRRTTAVLSELAAATERVPGQGRNLRPGCG